MKTKFKRILTLLLAFVVQISFAQQKTVSGTVTDSTGPLPGVSIVLKGSASGTETDFEGKYSIKAKTGDILVFRYLGYKVVEKTVGTSNTVNVTLEEDADVLDEIVVVGYGKTSKVDLTGSVVQLKSDVINNTVAPSVEQVFQGNATGVFVESQSAKLGGAIRINIRGVATVNGGSQPLFVVDGIVISNTDFGANTGGTSTNPLNTINSADIESIEILKDAASTAIYGSRGANGVVLITTKKGKAGKVSANISLVSGFAEPTRLRSFAGAEDYARVTGPLFDSYFGAGVGDSVLDHLSNGTDWRNNEVDTDWQSLAFQDAFFNITTLSLSGGNEAARFYASLSRTDKDGIYIGTKQDRSSALLNVDAKYKDFIDFGISLNYSRTKTNQVSGDNAFSTPIQLVAQAPISPVFDDTGAAVDYTLGFGTGYYNTIVELQNSYYFTVIDNLIASGYANFDLFEGLKLNTQLGINKINFRQENFQNNLTQDARADNGANLQYLTEQTVVTPQAFLSYNKTFDNHKIDFTGGFETRFEKNLFSQIRGIGFDTPGLTNIANATSIDRELTSSSENENFFRSFFGRINYKLNDKYLIGLSARWDSSSKFGVNSKTGFFPSASVGWKISEESFLKDNKVINFLKLRASYGITGNSNIADFRDRTLYSTGVYRGVTSYFVSQLGDPNLSWETTTQKDIGLEFQLFDNKIGGEINYYNKFTDDLFFNRPLPSTAGIASVFSNVGEISNTGIEVSLNVNAIEKDNFSWKINANFASNENIVESLPSGDILPTGSRFMNSVIVGESLGAFYGIEFTGVDPATGDAQYRRADGTITNNAGEAEQKVIGDPNPDWIGSITNTFTYKNFDLSFMFQTVQGNDIHLGGDSFMVGGWFDNILTSALDAWTQPGDITDTPRFDDAHVSQSTRFISDGSYVRLKNLTLGYNFNQKVLDKLKLDKFRIYFTGYNLLTFTDYEGWDPEVNADYRSSNVNIGSDFYSGPQEKSYSIGLLIGL